MPNVELWLSLKFRCAALPRCFRKLSDVSANNLGAKRGESCVMSILGLVTTGDASVTTAAKAGGITKVSHVDHETTNIIGVYAKFCTQVVGD